MFILATTLAFLIATAGWHYLFYSRAANRLSGVENERLKMRIADLEQHGSGAKAARTAAKSRLEKKAR